LSEDTNKTGKKKTIKNVLTRTVQHGTYIADRIIQLFTKELFVEIKTLRCSLRKAILAWLLFVPVWLFFGVVCFNVGTDDSDLLGTWIFIVLTVFLFCISVHLCVFYGRTFLFDETGCTVILGKYKKHYAWSQLKYVQLRDCRNTFYYSRTEVRPEERMIFSTKPLKFPRFIDVLSDAFWFHPLSCIFVGFYVYPQDTTAGGRVYIAPRKEFFQKLREWGVVYEDYR